MINCLCRKLSAGGILSAFFLLGFSACATGWPTNVLAPYVDFTAWPPYDIVGAETNTGLQNLTLAFIVADLSQNPTNSDPTNIPAWGGFTQYSAANGYRVDDISEFRALGGDVIVSFGGQAGTELAVYITDTNRLKAAYEYVVNVYGSTRIDFDIEGAWVADHPSIDRRSEVLASMQADALTDGSSLEVTLTLPVLPSGLDDNGLYVFQSAVSNGVNITAVNIMAMDYGDNAAPNPSGQMGKYAIMAATNLFNQMKSVYQLAGIPKTDAQLWQMVGITPMLGVNDISDEVFDQSAAAQVEAFAEAQNIGMLSFWCMNRDQPGQSGVTQTAFQFTEIFMRFAGLAAPTPVVVAADVGETFTFDGYASFMTFAVTLSVPSTNFVSVFAHTENGSAVWPEDYVPVSTVVVFEPGQTVDYLSVTLLTDTNPALYKTFFLDLENPMNANVFNWQAIGVITNDIPGIGETGGTNSGGNSNGIPGAGICGLGTEWQVTYNNGAAFQASLTLGNPSTNDITIGTMSFDASFTNIDWIFASEASGWVKPTFDDGQFTIANGWPVPAVIPAGGALVLEFQGEPGDNTWIPTDITINGVTIGECGGSTNSIQFTSSARRGNDLVLTWQTPGNSTNWIQYSSASLTNWTNFRTPIVISGNGTVTTNCTISGALTNGASMFYRVRVSY